MKVFLLAATLGLAASGAYAQDYDRDYRHRDPGERFVNGVGRMIEGRSSNERRCRTVITRRENDDGDRVTTRRRICD
jgi:hypothetical protein